MRRTRGRISQNLKLNFFPCLRGYPQLGQKRPSSSNLFQHPGQYILSSLFCGFPDEFSGLVDVAPLSSYLTGYKEASFGYMGLLLNPVPRGEFSKSNAANYKQGKREPDPF